MTKLKVKFKKATKVDIREHVEGEFIHEEYERLLDDDRSDYEHDHNER